MGCGSALASCDFHGFAVFGRAAQDWRALLFEQYSGLPDTEVGRRNIYTDKRFGTGDGNIAWIRQQRHGPRDRRHGIEALPQKTSSLVSFQTMTTWQKAEHGNIPRTVDLEGSVSD